MGDGGGPRAAPTRSQTGARDDTGRMHSRALIAGIRLAPIPVGMTRTPEQAGRIDLIGKASSLPPVEPSECVGEHERHDQDARPEDEHVLGLAQIEAADTADEHVADCKVEEAP